MMAVYTDESESDELDGVLTMFGLMVDTDDLIRVADEFNDILSGYLGMQENGRNVELKTRKFMRGKKGIGRDFNEEKRKGILEELCTKAVSDSQGIFGIVLSLEKVKSQKDTRETSSERAIAWHKGGMFVCSIVQKNMQEIGKSGEHAFVIFDGNNKVWRLSKNMQEESKWYDGIYQELKLESGMKIWIPRSEVDRFDRIVNRTVFSVNSRQSSLVQVSDAICHVYRRHFELMRENEDEVFEKEKNFYGGLFKVLEQKRLRVGDIQNTDCIRYFNATRHEKFEL